MREAASSENKNVEKKILGMPKDMKKQEDFEVTCDWLETEQEPKSLQEINLWINNVIVQSLVGEYRPMSQILMRPTFSRLFFIVVFEYVG